MIALVVITLLVAEAPPDCSYWSARINEARACAAENTKNGANAPSSMKSSYQKAAAACRAAIPKYEREAQSCRSKQAQQPKPGEKENAANNDAPMRALQDFASQLREQGRADAASALDRLREEYSGARYSGANTRAAIEKAKSLRSQNTDELAPDSSDTWDTTPKKNPQVEAIDGSGLADVIDFGAGDSQLPCSADWVVCSSEPSPPAPPENADYAELGYTDQAILGSELVKSLIEDLPGAEAAPAALDVALEEGDLGVEPSYSNEGFDSTELEALTVEKAREVISDRLPEGHEAVTDPEARLKTWTKEEAKRQGVGVQVDAIYGINEGSYGCAGENCTRALIDGVMRELPITSQMYDARDELNESIATVSTLAGGIAAATRDLISIGRKTYDLGVAVRSLARAKLFTTFGGKCVQHADKIRVTCAW
jgi:hypothetical protein